MKVCGFSFVRNAAKFSYPVVEAIQSVLPMCDAFIMSVGNSEDGTMELIRSIDSDKIRIIESVWDDRKRKNGEVLAEETNKVFDQIPEEYDWAVYIQADEVLHEKYHPVLTEAMERWHDRTEVEGILFKYLHFFGSFDYHADSRSWYRNEIRIIKNYKQIRSYKDAQGFRIDGRKLNVKPLMPVCTITDGSARPRSCKRSMSTSTSYITAMNMLTAKLTIPSYTTIQR